MRGQLQSGLWTCDPHQLQVNPLGLRQISGLVESESLAQKTFPVHDLF